MGVTKFPKPVTHFYTWVMPGIAIFFLLIFPLFITRPLLLGSGIFDFIVRGLLCLWFSFGYTILPNIKQKYRLYPNITWSKSDVSSPQKWLLLGLIFLFSVGVVAMTWWTIVFFIPIFQQYAFIFALMNGIIYFVPLALQYEVFKI